MFISHFVDEFTRELKTTNFFANDVRIKGMK